MDDSVKGSLYKSLILPILLFGAECWCLTKRLLQKLRSSHNRCVRAMCCVNRMQTHLFRIATSGLLYRLVLSPIHVYVSQQQLRRVGHVMRMLWYRLPRKMISSWVCSKRPKGCPNLTYGRYLKKSLKKANVGIEN